MNTKKEIVVNPDWQGIDDGDVFTKLKKMDQVDIVLKARVANVSAVVDEKGDKTVEIVLTDNRWPIMLKVPRLTLKVLVPKEVNEYEYVSSFFASNIINFTALGVLQLMERRRKEEESNVDIVGELSETNDNIRSNTADASVRKKT
jgi:hypothetical protein